MRGYDVVFTITKSASTEDWDTGLPCYAPLGLMNLIVIRWGSRNRGKGRRCRGGWI